jgi:uncharacterized protein involved in cysteine biosynthesis
MTPRTSGSWPALAIAILVNLAAGILLLWIVLYLLDANPANSFVDFIHDLANWLAGWSRGMFRIDNDNTQVVADYGIAAVVYAIFGNLLARVVRRL